MEPKEFWDTYAQGMSPADFMSAFDEPDPGRCVNVFVRQRPAFYGIVRSRTWKDTFAPGAPQLNRERVIAAMTTHLEETRDDWEAAAAMARQEREEWRVRRAEQAAARKAAEEAEAARLAAMPPPEPVPAETPAAAAETPATETPPAPPEA